MQRIAPHVKVFSRKLRKEMTDAELHLWRYLRMRQIRGLKFRRKCPIGSYILDFACVELKIALELDGGQHAEIKEKDAERIRWLNVHDWKVLRFWNNDVLQKIDSVLEAIDNALAKQS